MRRRRKAAPSGHRSPAQPSVLIVSGLSGSGKTVALRAIEDAGFYCVDNIPVSLITALVDQIASRRDEMHIAIGIDIREKAFLDDLDRILKQLRKTAGIELLYLEADPDVLMRRYKETRRPHPLGGVIENAITRERSELRRLRNNADRIINTSSLSPHELRKLITTLYGSRNSSRELSVSITSFGFKYGIPQHADLLFDVRFLPNPHFVPALRELSGRDAPVSRYVFSRTITKKFMGKLSDLLAFLIPCYLQEGKSYLSIAFGCTGGRHRSPAVAERIARELRKLRLDVHVVHRDLA